MTEWIAHDLWPGPYLEPDFTLQDDGGSFMVRAPDRTNVRTVTLLTEEKIKRNQHYQPGDIYFTRGEYPFDPRPAGFVVEVRAWNPNYATRLEIDVQWNDNY